ncbi:MAG: hypothetical protein OCD02_08860 [Spirochaetaceae bacterium]
MEKWKYKYSFLSGILFLLSFIFKEMVVNSPKNPSVIVFIVPYIMLILYSIGLFIGFLKYSKLNDRYILFSASFFVALFYSILVLTELIDRFVSLNDISYLLIFLPNFLFSVSLIYFAVTLFIQKKIYGKLTVLQGTFALVLGLSFLVPYLYLLRLPMFILFFISITYLILKNDNKLINKNKEPDLLSRGKF